MVHPVLSVGYERREITELARELADAGVRVLADVRLTPSSRRPGFSKTRLAAALADVGIEYRHFRALGNPRDNRDPFRRGDPAALARYEEVLATPEAAEALAELRARRRAGPIALLCLEDEPLGCHRTRVAAALEDHTVGRGEGGADLPT